LSTTSYMGSSDRFCLPHRLRLDQPESGRTYVVHRPGNLTASLKLSCAPGLSVTKRSTDLLNLSGFSIATEYRDDQEGLMVRIRLPPAESPRTIGSCRTSFRSAHRVATRFDALANAPFTRGFLSKDAIKVLKDELIFDRAVQRGRRNTGCAGPVGRPDVRTCARNR